MALVLYQYIGAAIDPFLNDLKPVQVKELKDAFEKLEAEGHGRGTLKPERMTIQGAREAEAAAEAGNDGGADGSAPVAGASFVLFSPAGLMWIWVQRNLRTLVCLWKRLTLCLRCPPTSKGT